MWPIDVVAFWNGAQMRDLLEAIVFILGGDDFAGLARSVVLVGLLAAAAGAIVRWRHESLYMFLVVFVLAALVLLVPRTTVTVRDVRAGTVHVVSDVPVGAAFLVTLSSRLGYWLGDAFETAFIPLDETAARFTRFGMAFPQRVAEAIRSLGAVTPTGRGFLNALMTDCVVVEMIENPNRAQEVFASANLEATISSPGWLNPGRHAVGPDGITRACPDMARDTFSYIRSFEVPELQKLLGAQLLGMEPNPAAAIPGAVASAETALLNLSRGFAEAVMQSVVRAGVSEGLQRSAHPDAIALATSLAAAQANVSSVLNYRTMSKIAETLLPTLRNAVEFVALAAFPIVIVIVMGTGIGGALLLRGYVMIFAWLALWPPLYAVVNYLMVRVDGSPMAKLIASYGGDTMVAAKLIQHLGATSQDMAGMLAILVPVIAFALVRGGDIAASNLVSGILGPASSAAQAQGATLAQGNISLGTVSWSTASMNRFEGNSMNLAPNVTFGVGGSFTGPAGTIVTDGSGSTWGVNPRPIDLGAALHFTAPWIADQTQRAATTAAVVHNLAATFDRVRTGARSEGVGLDVLHSAVQAAKTLLGVGTQYENQSGVNNNTGTGGQTGVTVGSSALTQGSASLGGDGKSGVPVPIRNRVPKLPRQLGVALLALEALANFSSAAKSEDFQRAMRELGKFSREEIQDGLRIASNAFQQVANESSDQATRTGAQRLSAAVEETARAMRSESLGVTWTDSTGRELVVRLGNGVEMKFDLNALLLPAAERVFGSVEKALEARRRDPIEFQNRMMEALQDVVDGIKQRITQRIVGNMPTPEDLAKDGRNRVDNAHENNVNIVKETGQRFREEVGNEQNDRGVNPNAPVPQDGVSALLAEAAQVLQLLNQQREDILLRQGSVAAVAQLMQGSSKLGRMWSGVQSMVAKHQGISGSVDVLRDMARTDNELSSVLLKAGQGVKLSDAELELVGKKLEAARSAQQVK